MRIITICVFCVCLFSALLLSAADGKTPSTSTFNYEDARKHEIAPHRRIIPLHGVRMGFNQLRLTLTVSPSGHVVDAKANGESSNMAFWPQLREEVLGWKFTPFEKGGAAVTAEVEEWLDLVPPERLPSKHVPAPPVGPKSKVAITLTRSGCFGTCPGYAVTVATGGISFEGQGYVVAAGTHHDSVDADDVRSLAKKFVDADFYSFEKVYSASVTDCPTYTLSIEIDGRRKDVTDYVGEWVGMPSVVTKLEEEVDSIARTKRWIEGEEGLVQSLGEEHFNFQTLEGQSILKQAVTRGETQTVRELIDAGVPLDKLPAERSKKVTRDTLLQEAGWLTAASRHAETLKVLMEASASKNDQKDKDLALLGAAYSGDVDSARALITYGANPNADLSKEEGAEESGGMTLIYSGAGSALISSAASGNPEMVREILRYHPDLEARDGEGKTAIFSAGNPKYGESDEGRADCVRLLAQAGADVNARETNGNTALHETFLTDVIEELLKLGADVNARNKNGETPLFTTYDDEALPILISHGADVTLRNNDGETVMQAAEKRGSNRVQALQNAMQKRLGL